jgi:hypothetical protein
VGEENDTRIEPQQQGHLALLLETALHFPLGESLVLLQSTGASRGEAESLSANRCPIGAYYGMTRISQKRIREVSRSPIGGKLALIRIDKHRYNSIVHPAEHFLPTQNPGHVQNK